MKLDEVLFGATNNALVFGGRSVILIIVPIFITFAGSSLRLEVELDCIRIFRHELAKSLVEVPLSLLHINEAEQIPVGVKQPAILVGCLLTRVLFNYVAFPLLLLHLLLLMRI